MNKKISLIQAKKKGLKRYFTGKPCIKNHISERFVASRTCSSCQKDRTKEWKQENKKHLRIYEKGYFKKTYNKRKENFKRSQKKYESTDKFRETRRKYYQKDIYKKAISKYRKKKYKTDILYSLKVKIRGRLQVFLKKKKLSKNDSTFKMLGCSPQKFKKYLEKKFKPGMNWKNHTKHGWHVDHKIPLSSAKNNKDLERLCHYTNLQPLWAKENMKKGNR